jgi:hypothetical protein
VLGPHQMESGHHTLFSVRYGLRPLVLHQVRAERRKERRANINPCRFDFRLVCRQCVRTRSLNSDKRHYGFMG